VAGSTGTSGNTSTGGKTATGGRTSAGGTGGKGSVGGTSAGAGGSTGVGGSTATGGTTATTGTSSFWPAAYQATQGDSGMNPGKDCLSSCHNHGFAFGGTVYDSSGNPLDSVEVGVKLTNGQFYSVFSGIVTGNFFYEGASLTLAGADIRVRDANGEKQMPISTKSSGACNSCHNGTTNPRITAP
jgi:hypothetical protein